MTKLSKDLLKIGKEILKEEKKDMLPSTDDEKIKYQSFNTKKESNYEL